MNGDQPRRPDLRAGRRHRAAGHCRQRHRRPPRPLPTPPGTCRPGWRSTRRPASSAEPRPWSGVSDVTVTATDGTGAAGTAVFAWTVANKVTVTAPKAESTWLGLPVKVQATAADSDKTQTMKWSAKTLPPGLSISGTGLISGRTTATGLFKTVVTATDGSGSAGSATIDWNVGAPITVHSAGLGDDDGRAERGLQAQAYTDVAKGDKVTWTASGLPAAVGFQQSSLLLYGWPAGAGTTPWSFKAKGSLGTSDQKMLKLVVKAAPDSRRRRPGSPGARRQVPAGPGQPHGERHARRDRELRFRLNRAVDRRLRQHRPRQRPLPEHRRVRERERQAAPGLELQRRYAPGLDAGERRRASRTRRPACA